MDQLKQTYTSVAGGSLSLMVSCGGCGALVLDQTRHDAWHVETMTKGSMAQSLATVGQNMARKAARDARRR